MALIKCAECGGEMSSQAAACPKCGAPPRPQSKPGTGKLRLFMTIAVGLTLALLFVKWMDPNSEANVDQAARELGEDTEAAARMQVPLSAFRAAKARLPDVTSKCRAAVADMAKFGSKTDFIPNYNWKVAGSTVLYFGHDMTINNAFNAAQRVNYTCSYDLGSGAASIITVN